MSDIATNQNQQTREAERAVLGGLMLETHRFDTVIQVIKENDFDGKDHQIIFQSMAELIEENNISIVSEKPSIGAEGYKIVFIHPKSTGGVLVELAEKAT